MGLIILTVLFAPYMLFGVIGVVVVAYELYTGHLSWT